MRQSTLKSMLRALREALAAERVDEFLTDGLTGRAFGEQKALPYHTPRALTARLRDLTQDKKVRQRMLDQIERGVEQGAEKWYDTSPLYAAFVNELGDEGPRAFRRFIDYNAATSPRSDVPAQLRRASFFYGLDRRGETAPFAMPEGYGHFAEKVQRQLVRRVRQDEGFNVRTGPKTASFAENLAGNHDPVTIDSHALALPAILSGDPRFLKNGKNALPARSPEEVNFNPRADFEAGNLDLDEALERPALWGGKPLDSEYAPLADYYRSLGRDAGLSGPQTQAAAWVGGGDITGVQSGSAPFMAHFVERLRETARQRGESVEEVLRRMIRGQAPLLAVPGLLVALRAALAREQEART